MWRGLAVRTSQVQRGVKGQGADVIDAVTGQRFSDNDVALQVVAKGNLIANQAGAGTVLPAVLGVRYIIHSAWVSYNQVVTDTGTVLTLTGTVLGNALLLANVLTPGLLVQNGNIVFPDLDVVLDTNTAVTTTLTGTYTGSVFGISYSTIAQEPS